MSGLNEHLKLSTEKHIKILRPIFTGFTHDDFWSQIDEIISDYAKIHPMEMEIIIRQNRQIAEGQYNKHGVAKEKGNSELRHHLRMPADLMTYLNSFCPELFDDKKNYHKFMKRYKGLCAYD